MNESDPIQDWKISNDHLGPSQYYPIEGLKGASNRAPIMSRVDSLLDSGRNFFQSGYHRTRLEKFTSPVRET